MKNTQRGFVAIAVIILVAILAVGGGYLYVSNQEEVETSDFQAPAATTTSVAADEEDEEPALPTALTDAQFIVATDDPQGEVLARGDVNGDGYEDAIVQTIHCGASCGVSLDLVLNEYGIARAFRPTVRQNFEPAYVGSSAGKSEISRVMIGGGVVALMGKGLGCGSFCPEEDWNVDRQIAYRFDGSGFVQIDPWPLLDGTYEFSEFASGNPGSNETWVYRLAVARGNDDTKLKLEVDGFQTMVRANATTSVWAESLRVGSNAFQFKYTSGNQDARFDEGDVLFTLVPTYEGLVVEWEEMQPNLDSSKEGAVFRRVE